MGIIITDRLEIAQAFANTIYSEYIHKTFYSDLLQDVDSEESDIDILIVSDFCEEIEDWIDDEVAWIMHDKGELISAHIISQDSLNNTRCFSFLGNDLSDGVEIGWIRYFGQKTENQHLQKQIIPWGIIQMLSAYLIFMFLTDFTDFKGIKAPETHPCLIHLFNLHYVKKDDFACDKLRYSLSLRWNCRLCCHLSTRWNW